VLWSALAITFAGMPLLDRNDFVWLDCSGSLAVLFRASIVPSSRLKSPSGGGSVRGRRGSLFGRIALHLCVITMSTTAVLRHMIRVFGVVAAAAAGCTRMCGGIRVGRMAAAAPSPLRGLLLLLRVLNILQDLSMLPFDTAGIAERTWTTRASSPHGRDCAIAVPTALLLSPIGRGC